MKIWGARLENRTKSSRQSDQEQEYKEYLYKEICRARAEWERASWAFQEALGDDEVDVAIYLLEAAERRYQIQLKMAKQAKVEWDVFKYGPYF
ncbi:DUF2508 family protein [Paenibacillus sp. Marseille-P2973]|uniref:DUF2508 family protein n=1 Tax=Paenibacillus sp. Marseille-P2973 TaxID=1871032 RepID=UPI001FFCD8AA|nr:DUF2508 family protein [Paenibacillus sp. Marseille-P2973]